MIRTVIATLLIASAYAQTFDIDVPAPGQQSMSLNGSTFPNCVQVTPTFNFHWAMNGTDIVIVHEGLSANDNMYFGWAIVADVNAPNRMAGADAVITSFVNDSAFAEDYLMTAVAGCDVDTGLGVCPDAISGNGEGMRDDTLNSVTNLAGFRQEGIHVVRYTRPIGASDARDLAISTMMATYIFAIGPLQGNGLAGFHAGSRLAMDIDFMRTPSSNCVQLSPIEATTAGETTTGGVTTTGATTTTTGAATPAPTADSGASVAKPEYMMAALVMGAALL